MTSSPSTIRPLLARFEEEIPPQENAGAVEYDESRMILLADGRPALLEPGLVLKGNTRLTRVGQETQDDD